MSKSLGTGIDPMDLINGGPRPPVFEGGGEFPAYGADAVRWGLLAMSSGQDVRFSEDKVAPGPAADEQAVERVAADSARGGGGRARRPCGRAPIEDRWILSRLARAKEEFAARIDAFDFSRAALGLYDFVYGELCDWYLELVKPRLRAGEPDLSATLLHVLTETLALAHPMIPFVTEEIYSFVPGASRAARGARQRHGGPTATGIDAEAEAELARLIEAVQAIRAWRDSAGVQAGRGRAGAAGGRGLRTDRRAPRPAGAAERL